jgi:hypothetical protein
MKHNLANHVKNLGMGTSYFLSLKRTPTKIKSFTHINSPIPAAMKVPIRRIKSGQLAHVSVLSHMHNQKWYKMNFEQQLEAIMCPCDQGVQDVRHTVVDCELTKHLTTAWEKSIKHTMTEVASLQGVIDKTQIESMTAEECIATMLHTSYTTNMSKKLIELLTSYGEATNTYLSSMEKFKENQDESSFEQAQDDLTVGFTIQPYEMAVIDDQTD